MFGLVDWSSGLRRDLRAQWRRLYGTALILSLAIAPTQILFAFQDVLYFRVLPVPDPESLQRVKITLASGKTIGVFSAEQVILAGSQLGTPVGGVGSRSCELDVAGATIEPRCAIVTGDFFDLLGVTPALGIAPGASSDAPSIVLSDELWRQFGQASNVGSWVNLVSLNLETNEFDRLPVRIAAIMPRGFRVPDGTQVWINENRSSHAQIRGRFALWFRPQPNASVSNATTALAASLRPNDNDPVAGVAMSPVVSDIAPRAASSVGLLLAGAVTLAILGWILATINTVGDFQRRAHSVALRIALGAPPFRLYRPMILEALVIAASSWVLATLLAYFLTPLLSSGIPFMAGREPEVNGRALLFGLLVTTVGAVTLGLTGWLLLIQVTRGNLLTGARRLTPQRGSPLEIVLIGGAVICVAFVLSIASGLATSFARTYLRHPGFDSSHLAYLTLRPALRNLADAARVEQTQADLSRLTIALSSIPGVTSVSRSQGIPFGSWQVRGPVSAVNADGKVVTVEARYKDVTESFFEVLRVPVEFRREIVGTGETAAVVNRTLAMRLWGRDNPVGEDLIFDKKSYRVVGVCADFLDTDLTSPAGAQLYRLRDRGFHFLIRSVQGSDDTLRAAVDTARKGVPGAAVDGRTYRDYYRQATESERTRALFMVVVACFAAIVGFSGMSAHLARLVLQNSQVAGVMIALGGGPVRVAANLFKPIIVVIALAVVIGVFAGVASSKFLPDLTGGDSQSLLAGAAVVVVLTMLASVVAFGRSLRPLFSNPVTAWLRPH